MYYTIRGSADALLVASAPELPQAIMRRQVAKSRLARFPGSLGMDWAPGTAASRACREDMICLVARND